MDMTGDGDDGAALFAGPVKRSVTIAGHSTSITLEPLFWDALREWAHRLDLPLNALVARIDAVRIGQDDPPNLASAVRLWLLDRYRAELQARPGEAGTSP